jgi:hypothetical protein
MLPVILFLFLVAYFKLTNFSNQPFAPKGPTNIIVKDGRDNIFNHKLKLYKHSYKSHVAGAETWLYE